MFRTKFVIFSVVLSLSLSSCAKNSVPFSAYPVQNPQGVYFESDPEFVAAYMRYMNASKHHKRPESATSILNLKSVNGLEMIDPVGAGWEVENLPPGKTELEEMLDNSFGAVKSSVKTVMKKARDSAEAVKNIASKQLGLKGGKKENSSEKEEVSQPKTQQPKDAAIQSRTIFKSKVKTSSGALSFNRSKSQASGKDTSKALFKKKKSGTTTSSKKTTKKWLTKHTTKPKNATKSVTKLYPRERIIKKIPFCVQNCPYSKTAVYSTYPVVGRKAHTQNPSLLAEGK